jgi:hypothetical protein
MIALTEALKVHSQYMHRLVKVDRETDDRLVDQELNKILSEDEGM